jgi:hypothetical protein
MPDAALEFPPRRAAALCAQQSDSVEMLMGNDVIGKTIQRKKCACLGTSQMRKRSLPGTRLRSS